jgi:hypothetical protein
MIEVKDMVHLLLVLGAVVSYGIWIICAILTDEFEMMGLGVMLSFIWPLVAVALVIAIPILSIQSHNPKPSGRYD